MLIESFVIHVLHTVKFNEICVDNEMCVELEIVKNSTWFKKLLAYSVVHFITETPMLMNGKTGSTVEMVTFSKKLEPLVRFTGLCC